jgi:hypothetical protein
MVAWPDFETAASSSLRCTGSSSTRRIGPAMGSRQSESGFEGRDLDQLGTGF